jgi:flagellar biosynthesis GTPase FlhF
MPIVDTLKIYEALKKALALPGIEPKAKAITEALEKAFEEYQIKQIEALATKEDLAKTETRLKEDLAKIETRLKEDLTILKEDLRKTETILKEDLRKTETILKEDLRKTETILKEDLRKTETRLKEDLIILKEDLRKTEIRLIRWQVGLWITQIGILLGVLFAFFR